MARSLCSCAHKSISLSVTLLLKRETRDNNAFLTYCSLKRETQRSCTSGGNVPVALLLRSPYTEADDQRYRLGWRKKKNFSRMQLWKPSFSLLTYDLLWSLNQIDRWPNPSVIKMEHIFKRKRHPLTYSGCSIADFIFLMVSIIYFLLLEGERIFESFWVNDIKKFYC